ncbi:MAG TPA: LrgB family protein [Candidatus Sulfotelmatobacter sp.]|jgi:predicted murein hydrolase (TIGR00659 family)|nr:LrgB family protein [Candidatus Sulfotelmatobacter sp.]
MTPHLQELWVYLSTTPLLWLTLTLVVFQGAEALFRRSGANPLCNPVLLSVSTLSVLLLISGTEYKTYFGGAQFLQFLLGPATVSLAVPLYRQFEAIRKSLVAIVTSLLVGSLTAIGTAVGIAYVLGAEPAILLSLAPKSVTSPIAMGIAEQIGGIPSLAAVMVILTGITGAAFGSWVLDLVRVKDEIARGVAWGIAAHGIGTARAMHSSAVSGAFAGLAMGLNGLATALLLPALVGLVR